MSGCDSIWPGPFYLNGQELVSSPLTNNPLSSNSDEHLTSPYSISA